MSTERVRKLLAEAAELPTEERAKLVHELARTLPEGYESVVRLDVGDDESPNPPGVLEDFEPIEPAQPVRLSDLVIEGRG